MRFSVGLAAAKGLRKKEEEVRSKADEFEGPRKRRRATMDSKACGFDEIPDELVMEILARARLPAKHVTRLMCVSRLWYSLISSRFFSKLFLEYPSLARRPRMLVSLVDLEDQRKYYFVTSSWTPDVNWDTPVYILDKTPDLPGLGGFFVGALRGLICVRLGRSLRVCNLTTNQLVTLPAIRSRIFAEAIDNIDVCFVHDPVQDEYKVLTIVWEVSKEKDRVVRSQHQVLVLGPGASWRNTRSRHVYPPHCPCSPRVIIDGVVYYGAWIDKKTSFVMSFDLASEDFSLIELPIEAGIVWHTTRASLMDYGGRLALLDWSRLEADASVSLWVMEDAEKRKWSNKTLVLPISLMNFDGGDGLIIEGTTRPSEVRLSMTTNLIPIEPRLFVIYDLEKNKIARKVVISPLQHLWYFGLSKGMQSTVFEDAESITYLET